ncbi:MAG: tetratricopeptide repeat protein [Panacagrimonas sp.]
MSPRSAVAASAVLCLASLVCASPAALGEDGPAAPLTAEQTMQVQLQVMAGEMAAGRGQPGVAAQAFVEALALQPDAALASRATQLALAADDEKLALRAAHQWLALEPNNADPREVIARLALRGGDLDEAYAQTLEIVRGHAGGAGEGFRHVALLLSGEAGKGEQVRLVLDRLIAQYPDLGGARYARALAALRFEDLVAAEKSAREAVKLEPTSRDNRVLLVGVLVRTKQIAEADTIVKQLLDETKEPGDLRMTYAKLLLEAGEREQARAQIKAALDGDEKNDDARYALGVLAFNDGKLDEAEALFSPLKLDRERGGDAEYQLGRIAEARKQYETALQHYERVTGGGQAIEAVVRRSAMLARLDRVDEARGALEQLRQQFPPLVPRLTQAEAELLLDIGRHEDAVAVYSAALQRTPKDDGLLYGRSLVFDKMGRFADAETDLRAILAEDQNDARAMNALGYMLVVNTTRFEEAHKLIEGALKQVPNDPAVIDSMGWVLFKMGKADEARNWLEKALAAADDPEISAHLGEVLWSLGQRDRAKEIFDKALAREPDHRALRETVERLTR